LPALLLLCEKGWNLGKAAVAGGREGAPLPIFSFVSQLTPGITGSAHLGAPLALHLWFIPSYFFPMAETAWTWPETTTYPCGIKIQFCLNY